VTTPLHLTFAGLICVLVASVTFAATRTELYDLQERCAKRTEQVFRRDWGPDGLVKQANGTLGVGSFHNHYNARLNKCFYLLRYETAESTLITLFDVNDQNEYGMLFMRTREPATTSCRVGQRVCATESEWKRLIAPYMEE